MRNAARAEVISARSMEAIRRLNRVVVGAKPMEAVLDIVVPFLCRGGSPHLVWG